MKSYSTTDVARLLGVSAGQVRSLARAGVLSPDHGPRGAFRFSFQDLVLLRTAKALAEARLPARRIRRALRRLVEQLPRGRSLSEVRITAEGDCVVVRDEQAAWQPESGQLLLDFTVAELATRAGPVARRLARDARRAEEDLSATRWFALGMDLEAAAPDDARDAYRRALELDPSHTEARLNLGRLLQESGRIAEAEAHYRAVLASAAAVADRAVQPRHRARGPRPHGRGDCRVSRDDRRRCRLRRCALQPRPAVRADRPARGGDSAFPSVSRSYGMRLSAISYPLWLRSFRDSCGHRATAVSADSG